MATTEERMQILKMIEEGKISASDGAELLRALEQDGPAKPSEPLKGASQPRWFRVRVTDLSTGKSKVSVNIPMGLVNVGMKMGARFAPEMEGVDFDELTKVGSMMGSGGMIVMDENTCMVDIARYFLSFLKEESCGKCIPCTEGIKRMLEILTRITAGHGKIEDIALLEELAPSIRDSSLCGLGQSAPNPVLTTLKYFREEYEAHILEGRCPAGQCKALITYTIDADDCTGCMVCLRACPTEAITGARRELHVIDPELCTRCDTCRQVCKFDAVLVA